ncbi:MAG: 4-hydroxy-tetrahydrodipicolinate synthase [Firmicutes bacterium HGW-Firmicutes-12]|nr:MAG: 4-hydroxy-tetrahydrodipicolinate synthase [Firmicutes bacterium HGW-Firmicutes-12]
MIEYPRVFTAMITPLKEDESVDFNGAQKLALHLISKGSKGLVISGTTGESPTLTKQEKLDLFSAVKEAVGSKGYVIAGTGSNSTADSVRLTEEASKLGIDGVMAVTPYYNKPNQEGLYQHFRAIAKATSLPLVLYNVPGRTAVNMLPETVAKLAEIQNVIALKEACGNTDQVTEIKTLVSEDFLIYSGDDCMTLPMLAVGSYGVISVAGHVAAEMISQMVTAYVEGQVKEAYRINKALYPLFKAMFVTTNPIPVKKAVSLLGLPAGKPRLPMVEATPEETTCIKRVMLDLGLL